MKGIGLMSGSSLDGIDLAFVSFEQDQTLSWELLSSIEYEFPKTLRDKLAKITFCNAKEIAIIESEYTLFLADRIKDFISQNDLNPAFLSIHGHTVLHYPEHQVSWQLLNGGMLSSLTFCQVVCDFRNQDMALKGQGTPMAVIADRDLFSGYDAYINMGGITNISINSSKWHAFDICPCNQVLNYFASRLGNSYDHNGSFAKDGIINQDILASLLTDNYILQKGPKSIDNQWITDYWIPKILSFPDTDKNYLRTYVEFICDSIVASLDLASAKILISGGGANNIYMMDVLKDKLLKLNKELIIPDPAIINFKEAILIAYAAFLRINRKNNFVSQATGASIDSIGGALYLPPHENSPS